MTSRLLFAQLVVGDEFYFDQDKFRKSDLATALNLDLHEPRFFDQFDSVEKIQAK
jgi:hypothetical protein